ncbi:helix-turn-helix domain-containing protein [Mitsuokella multacida]|uniref:helix-turn-helix domain-containing protein n=1 Tax=Mitsuokella multacida TaxID=52226 RepID=UPI003F805A13
MTEFTKKIQALRQSRHLTQKDMARIAGCTVLCYQRYEYGQRKPDVQTAIRIADALGVQDLRMLWSGNFTAL